jgi:hypothetical protein
MMARPQDLFTIPTGVETRWASPENPRGERGAAGKVGGGRKGSAFLRLPAGQSAVLAEAAGTSGTVRRMWITVNDRTPRMLRGLRLDFTWDGAATPAVSAPLGDFFGVGLGRTAAFHSALFSNPEGRSFNCFVPMPFRTGMRLVLTNESGVDLSNVFYDVDYTLGDAHGKDALYFHAVFRRENPTHMQRDYEIVPRVAGRGRFLGSNMGVIINRGAYLASWWGEGEVKVYLDGDRELPTLCGTGVEDYVGTGWSGLGANTYAEAFQGTVIDDREHGQVAFYRHHVPDPVYFQRDLRVTIQQIGSWDPLSKPVLEERRIELLSTRLSPVDLGPAGGTKPFGLFERVDDWSSCAYLFLDRPENGFPALAPPERRMEGLLESKADPATVIEY